MLHPLLIRCMHDNTVIFFFRFEQYLDYFIDLYLELFPLYFSTDRYFRRGIHYPGHQIPQRVNISSWIC